MGRKTTKNLTKKPTLTTSQDNTTPSTITTSFDTEPTTIETISEISEIPDIEKPENIPKKKANTKPAVLVFCTECNYEGLSSDKRKKCLKHPDITLTPKENQ